MSSINVEEVVELSMLYDFYGALLKENNRKIFEAYVMDDFSLGEIAQEVGISRQGVHDAVKRVSVQLRTYEQKLGLVEKFRGQQDSLKQAQSVVEKLLPYVPPALMQEVEQVLLELAE